jgi:uncharacterized protein YgbK (DUF1537 family)
MLLGVIADDLTGATDVAVNLRAAGLSVVQINGVPRSDLHPGAVDAVVVALKSRTIAVGEACALSLASLAWLREHGAERIYFKYCSTFDSTAAGNIGPVTDALADALDAGVVPTTPAYPRNQRTVYRGYLFVGDALLSETGMRNHPLTPMTDANLVRVLQAQTPRPVGLVPLSDVDGGPEAVQRRLEALRATGIRHAIVDATEPRHLEALGAALIDYKLTTGGAGLASGLAGQLRPSPRASGAALRRVEGPLVILECGRRITSTCPRCWMTRRARRHKPSTGHSVGWGTHRSSSALPWRPRSSSASSSAAGASAPRRRSRPPLRRSRLH